MKQYVKKKQRLGAVKVMFQSACADLFQTFYNDTMSSPLLPFHELRQGGVLRHEDVLVSNGIGLLESYTSSLESLRVYYIQQMVRITSDYSDTFILVPEFLEGYLQHRNVPVSELQQKYCRAKI